MIVAKRQTFKSAPKRGKTGLLNGKSTCAPTAPKTNGHVKRASDQPATMQEMFQRADWTEFRDPNRISNKAGVPYEQLPKLIAKELCDDALDASGAVEFGFLEGSPDTVTFFVSDAGPGVEGTDEEIAQLYSIRRNLTSSKMVRSPTRGMLGNGLRVVAGVVLIARGQIRVSTRGRTLTLEPRADGRTVIISVKPWDGVGTRVEVTLHGPLAEHARSDYDGGLFGWAEEAKQLTGGQQFKGKSSPHWYDESGFWELLQSAGETRIETFVETSLDSCSDKAAEVVKDLARRACDTITRAEAEAMLKRAQSLARPIVVERLGKVGRRDDYFGYAIESGEFTAHGATIPFLVEAWVNRSAKPGGEICLNRTPVCAEVTFRRDEGSDYAVFGCNLANSFVAGRKAAGDFKVLLNVTTPYIPLTSSGKEPDLSSMWGEISVALEKAIRVAKRLAPKTGGKKRTQKAIIRARIKEAGEKLSGGWTYLFSLRQLFYELRPYLIQAIGREPEYGTFGKIVGAYEDEVGDVANLYRDDRGTLYHPHTREIISLGTRAVAVYERPEYGFRSILVSEKEGLFPVLKHAGWPETFDCALCSSKGFATRAVRTLLRLLEESPEPITIFVIHDADGPGTLIYGTLKNTLEPYGIEVINLGLDPEEGRAMGLIPEPVKRKGHKRVPVADYVPDADKAWLQGNRIELNAMTTPQFIEWLTAKVQAYFQKKRMTLKVLPPVEVLNTRLEAEARAAIERRIVDKVMKDAKIPARVQKEFARVQGRVTSVKKDLAKSLPSRLKSNPAVHWTDIVKLEAGNIAGGKQVKNAKLEA